MNRATLARTAALALIGACAPLASAEPWFSFHWGTWDHGRRPVVVQRVPVVRHEPVFVPVRHQRVEVLPCDLRFAAYQSRDTVIITATGANRAAGFCTSLTACDMNGATPAITLLNSSPDECGAQVITPFSLTASIHSHRTLRCITIRAAGQCFEVPVTQAQCLS
jgi:hypothetical protein